jgi:acetylornithine deacetylase/succinyl-diaminopimelate desuccinylase-like protein
VLSPDPNVSKAAADWMLENEPEHWSMLHTSVVPTILTAGYRYNVIPSEARATLDVRLHRTKTSRNFRAPPFRAVPVRLVMDVARAK